MKRKYTDIYERGNDYDQAELFGNIPISDYVTLEMLNAVISKLIIMIGQKQNKLDLGYIEYEDDKYLHDVNDKAIFAEVANNAINDENGNNINDTYLKKADQTYQYNEFDEIVGINNSAIAAGQGSKRLVGENGIYVYDDLTANIIGISAKYAYASALSGYQTKLTDEQMIDIESIPFKLDKTEFNETISSYATKEFVEDQIADIGTPLVIRGSKTCAEIEALDDPKIGDVYCIEDTGIIHQPDYEDLNVNVKDEVAFTSENGWIIVGREVAVDLSDYYKKNETSGASQISAAIDAVDQQFSNYYPMSSTSGAAQISDALENKVDIDTLYDYYQKTETSSKDELNTALANKANVSSLTAYITNTELANNYYDKTETSSKEQISAALETKADASDLDLYYTMAETSGSVQLNSAFDLKLDTSAFSSVSSDFVQTSSMTGYQSAGNYMSANALDELSSNWNEVSSKQDKLIYGWDGDGKIISIDGSAIAGQGGATFTGDVQGALDEVYTNSSNWLVNDDLSGYVTEDYLTANYYTIDEIDSEFAIVESAIGDKVDYEYLQDNYYNITETSAASSISAALEEKLDITASEDFVKQDEISATDWNDTTDVVRENSAIWSQGNSAVNDLVTANSGLWNSISNKLDTSSFNETISGYATTGNLDYVSGVVDEKLDTTSFDPNAFYPMYSNPSGYLTAHQSLTAYYTTAQTYSKSETYNKEEVNSLMDGKIVVLTELPIEGDSGVIYYIGPNTSVSGDQYDEFIWDATNEKFIMVGEHSLDLSGYATDDDIAEVYEYVSESLDDKLDITAIEGSNNTITGINGSAIIDTTYSAGDNINITNKVISGKDWSDDIESAVSELADDVASAFSEIDDELALKQDKSAMSGYVPTSATIISIGSNNVIENQSPGVFAQGVNNSASIFSLSQGQGNRAITHSLAQGLQNYADNYAFAQGTVSTAQNNSLAQGVQCSSINNSIAQGAANTAHYASFSQGESNRTYYQSLAQGIGNSANTGSLAQGGGNSAYNYSIAQGAGNYASGWSQAFGNHNIIEGSGMAIGTYNQTSSDVSFVIGNGTAKTARSDLFIIKHDGTVSSTGDFIVCGKSLSSVYDNVSSNSGTWDAKQNALTFNYENTSITGINGSAIGGAGGGDMYESNLNLDGNYITGYNSTALKDYTITADLTNLQSVSSTVYTNSATNWQNVITGITIDSTAVTPVNYVVDIPLSGKVDKVTGKGLSTNDYVNSAKDVVDLADAVIPNDAAANNQLVSNSTLLSAIANVGSFEIAPLGNNDEPAPTGTISTKTFYLTKPSTAAPTDPYTEWIYTSSSPSNTAWNIVGTTEIDLDGYVQFPSTYTADHLIAFGSNDTIYDTGVTINDLAGSITGITLAGGSELGITNKVVKIPGATTASAGIMTSSDKAKLDGIESGANVNVQSDWSESDSTEDSYIANKPDIVIPISSNAFAKATQIVVVSAMPSSPNPTTIYLVKEAT